MKNDFLGNELSRQYEDDPATLDTPLTDSSEDVLVSIAILGLIATVADGVALTSEIDQFTQVFEKRFSLSRSKALRVIGIAVEMMQLSEAAVTIDSACDHLNAHLNCEQKMTLFDGLADVVVADRLIHSSEGHFMDLIAQKLGLEDALMERFPL